MPGKVAPFLGAGSLTLDTAHNPAPRHSIAKRFIPAASVRRPMERTMRVSQSSRICLSCNRPLPRAASRCPWCVSSIVVPSALAHHPQRRRHPGAAVNVARIEVHSALAAQAIEGSTVTAQPALRASIPNEDDAGLSKPDITGTSILALRELVAPEDILMEMEADRKRVALSRVSEALGLRVGKSQGAVLKALLRRERLGPTSISCYASAR